MSVAARLIDHFPFPPVGPEPAEYPDPQLAANLYCAGRLDRVIHEVVVPFRRELRAIDPEYRYRLWILRYGRGGEHLKVRVHGPPEYGPFLRECLEGMAQRFFDGLKDSADPISRRKGVPPVDEADLEDGHHPDRTLIWTRHLRSSVVLGEPSLLGNDDCVARLTACLGTGCEAILENFQPDSGGSFPYRRRQLVLSRLLVLGLEAMFSSNAERRAFLAYHRDWLVRSLVLGAGSGPEKAQSVLDRFRTEAEQMGPGPLLALKRLVGSLDASESVTDTSRVEAAWCRSLTALWQFLGSFTVDIDPFAEGPTFPLFFKVCHGIANPLGVTPLNEAFTHHLLLCATGGDDLVDRFVLIPG